MVGGDVPFHLKLFALKMTHSPLTCADFDQYLLITSQRQELAKNSSITAIRKSATPFERAIDNVRTLPLNPPKGRSKSKFVIVVNKNQFKSNKLCYKLSLCENFQRQSCSRIIPLSNGVYMLAVNVTLEPNI